MSSIRALFACVAGLVVVSSLHAQPLMLANPTVITIETGAADVSKPSGVANFYLTPPRVSPNRVAAPATDAVQAVVSSSTPTPPVGSGVAAPTSNGAPAVLDFLSPNQVGAGIAAPTCNGAQTCVNCLTPNAQADGGGAAPTCNGAEACLNCLTQPVAQGWRAVGGASFYMLQPYSQNNIAYSVTSQTSNPAGTVLNGSTQTQTFGYAMQPAMEIWLGVTSPSGMGVRAGYFHLNGGSGDQTLNVPSSQYNSVLSSVVAVNPSPFLFNSPPGGIPQQNPATGGLFGGPSPFIVAYPGAPASTDRFVFHSDLNINAFDFECTGVWKTNAFSLVGGFGGRYFQMTQDYSANMVNVNPTGSTLTESLQYSRAFQGAGPTVSAQFNWHPFSPNLSLFAGGRGSLVVGQTSQVTSGSRNLNDPTGAFNPIGVPDVASNSFRIPYTSGDMMPITELELGLQYSITRSTSTYFFRGAVVDKTYFGAGNSSDQNGNLSLLGFQFSAGLYY